MKKFLLGLFMCLSFVCLGTQSMVAQTQYYRSISFAIKYNTGSGWTAWSDWQDSDVKISINFDNDIVTIYSPVLQKLQVITEGESYTDSSGGANLQFGAYDMVDDCICTFRLRMETNGNSQIYLTYSNVCYVYNVRKI